ncbi:MAG: DsbA family protein [Flaviaesturariibacter sp.]|nr:DsbA family protein [Flaviaesturariibacter sp.]
MASAANPLLYYCYDAYCGWCYGFSPVIRKIEETFRDRLDFDVLSGGMILPETPTHFGPMARYVQTAYKQVETLTGIRFGDDFLWHVNNPDETDWYPDSTKPGIALCIFKEYFPGRAIEMASDLQVALNSEGRDLTDDEAYRHLLERYGIPEDDFYTKLKSEEYKDKAYYEFALCKQLQVKGFPCVFLQVSDSKFYMIAQGYTDFETVAARIEKVLADPEIN